MAKVTLYVPDDLWKRAQEQSEQVNLSQVFQQALKSEFQRVLRLQEQADLDAQLDLPTLRKRFSEQQREIFRYGYAAGIEQAQQYMSYADFRFCESVNWDTDAVVGRLTSGDIGLADWLLDAVLDHVPQDGINNPFNGAAAAGVQMEVAEGFVAALHRAWDLITDDLWVPAVNPDAWTGTRDQQSEGDQLPRAATVNRTFRRPTSAEKVEPNNPDDNGDEQR